MSGLDVFSGVRMSSPSTQESRSYWSNMCPTSKSPPNPGTSGESLRQFMLGIPKFEQGSFVNIDLLIIDIVLHIVILYYMSLLQYSVLYHDRFTAHPRSKATDPTHDLMRDILSNHPTSEVTSELSKPKKA